MGESEAEGKRTRSMWCRLLQRLQEVRIFYKTRNPLNLKLCRRGEWNDRILVETVLSMLTLVTHFKTTIRLKARAR